MLAATSHHPFFGPFQKSKKKKKNEKNRTKVQAFVHRRSKKRQVVSSFQDLKAKPQLGSKAKTAVPEVTGVKNTPLGGSSPASMWLVTPIYKPFIPCGRGTTLLRGTYEYYETWLLATYSLGRSSKHLDGKPKYFLLGSRKNDSSCLERIPHQKIHGKT